MHCTSISVIRKCMQPAYRQKLLEFFGCTLYVLATDTESQCSLIPMQVALRKVKFALSKVQFGA